MTEISLELTDQDVAENGRNSAESSAETIVEAFPKF
jgi:hypothetical protein